MIFEDFKTLLLAKSVGRTTLPQNSELSEKIHTGLKLIAKETVPLRLVVKDKTGVQILRSIDTDTKTPMYIRFPIKPLLDTSEIDIDEALLDALAFYVMAGLERGNANTHMGMYHGEIDMNNDRLIESALTDTTNDSCKFCVFP